MVPNFIAPLPLFGQGKFTASNVSTAINAALTLAPNSAPFPTQDIGGALLLKVEATNATGIYVCWQGGTCTAANGEYIAPGEGVTQIMIGQSMTTQPPTVIATGTPTVVVEWFR